MKRIIICLSLWFLLNGCGALPAQGSPTAIAPPLAVTALSGQEGGGDQFVTPAEVTPPVPIEGDFKRDTVFIEEFEIQTSPDLPGMVFLHIKGQLPTPCHQLGSQICPSCVPDSPNLIVVNVYSLIETERVCRGPTTPFERDIPLGVYTQGEYSVEVNGQQVVTFIVGEIDD